MSIAPARVAIVANGFADGPAQALRDFLVDRGANVITIFHPLVAEAGNRHEITVYKKDNIERRNISFPVPPPLSFALDPFVPLHLPKVDVWFGFNSLACARGLVARRFNRAGTVVYWCVDFVPNRFGKGPLTHVYDALDAMCCRRADARVELSRAAVEGRNARHSLASSKGAPVTIVPMGAWVERVPNVTEDGWRRRHVVFLGHLVRRNGVRLLLDALAALQTRNAGVTATVIGGGPLEQELRDASRHLGLEGSVTFLGFVRDHREVEHLLADGSVAVAPYERTADSFTNYADPGKLKAYLAAGLPILLTDVPPNAAELAAEAGAQIVPFDIASFASAIENTLDDHATWRTRRALALQHARAYDWAEVLADALASIDSGR